MMTPPRKPFKRTYGRRAGGSERTRGEATPESRVREVRRAAPAPYSEYGERAAEGGNEADGPFSAAWLPGFAAGALHVALVESVGETFHVDAIALRDAPDPGAVASVEEPAVALRAERLGVSFRRRGRRDGGLAFGECA